MIFAVKFNVNSVYMLVSIVSFDAVETFDAVDVVICYPCIVP